MKILQSINKLSTYSLLGVFLAFFINYLLIKFIDGCNVNGPRVEGCIYQGIDYSIELTTLGWFLAIALPLAVIFKFVAFTTIAILKRSKT